METAKQTHDIKILSAMVDLLMESAMEIEDHGFSKTNPQIRYEEIASALNKKGHTNRAGKPLNHNALKQVVHRLKKKPDVMKSLKPDWDDFRLHDISETPQNHPCLVCGAEVTKKRRTNHNYGYGYEQKTCSPECGGVYQEHKDAPHDPKFPTIFHQMKYEETVSKIN